MKKNSYIDCSEKSWAENPEYDKQKKDGTLYLNPFQKFIKKYIKK
jgi:hypothetical protein